MGINHHLFPVNTRRLPLRASLIAGPLAMVLTLALGACGDKPPAVADPATTTEDAAASTQLERSAATWTPEALEELLAPIALYPDAVLGQVLVASTNPQEVLDAGNWLLQNQKLQGEALDDAAEKIGFTPPVRGLLQFSEVIDMLCMQMDWTTELGQAFVNDQAGVLEAVQRLRAQAKDVGNLVSSDKLAVGTEQQDGNEVITVASPDPKVVYVPQYDPVAVYAPPAPATAPAPATSTTVVTEDKGHSTGAMVTTGLLAFGAGLLVAEVFDDDDDDYYYPRYYGPPMPYYPPYPYRPSYGNGYYPSNGYNRPPNYQRGFNNNTIIVNNDNKDYWNRYDGNSGKDRNLRKAESPISAAKPKRSELDSLNTRAREQPKRVAPAKPDSWKGQSSYAGAKDKAKGAGSGARIAPQPKIQGSYAGGKAARSSPAAQLPAARPAAKPATRPESSTTRAATADRGRPATAPGASRPSAPARTAERSRSSAISGASGGGMANKAASQRGRQSMPKGVPARAKGSGRSGRR